MAAREMLISRWPYRQIYRLYSVQMFGLSAVIFVRWRLAIVLLFMDVALENDKPWVP